MGLDRKPLQGVLNIIRFNWQFYVIAGLVIAVLGASVDFIPEPFRMLVVLGTILAALMISISLIGSFYIYDISNLYKFPWLPNLDAKTVLNINAGFDETSSLLKKKHPAVELTVCDFYDPEKHTEVSIKRARNAYPPLEGTISVSTEKLPLADHSFDTTLAFFSAHEIRDSGERVQFFKELARVTKPNGEIIVTEHLRDLNNFAIYTVGFFHFHSCGTWRDTFQQANLAVTEEIKTTRFITTFVLAKTGL